MSMGRRWDVSAGKLARTTKRRVERVIADRSPRAAGPARIAPDVPKPGTTERTSTGTAVDNLVDPVFLLSSPRSGSTLLRAILDSHSQICAPQEFHFRDFQVRPKHVDAIKPWRQLGFSYGEFEDILWDRMLHLLLVRSGKRIIVEKTPQNVLDWRRLHRKWPNARYLHLRRHPLRIVESRARARPDRTVEFQVQRTALYCAKLHEASQALPGITLRYEDLTARPAEQMRRVCAYLGVDFEPGMLDYHDDDFRVGWGDWSEKIRSGRIQPSPPPPPIDEVPVDLRGIAIAWGYA